MQIFVSGWSLRSTIRRKKLRLRELPRFVRTNGFRGLELADRLLSGYDEVALEELGRSCADAGCAFVLDVNSDLTRAREADRRSEIEHVRRMLELGHALRARAVRICLGGQSFSIHRLLLGAGRATASGKNRGAEVLPMMRRFPSVLFSSALTLRLAHAWRTRRSSRVARQSDKSERAVAALSTVVPLLSSFRIRLAIENHWGITSQPENIVRIVRAVDSELVGTCPDFGNFPGDVDRYAGLERLASRALHVHAPSARFDHEGEERSIDYGRCLRLLRDRGYDGAITVEYNGGGDDLEGCLRTRDLLLRHADSPG